MPHSYCTNVASVMRETLLCFKSFISQWLVQVRFITSYVTKNVCLAFCLSEIQTLLLKYYISNFGKILFCTEIVTWDFWLQNLVYSPQNTPKLYSFLANLLKNTIGVNTAHHNTRTQVLETEHRK